MYTLEIGETEYKMSENISKLKSSSGFCLEMICSTIWVTDN